MANINTYIDKITVQPDNSSDTITANFVDTASGYMKDVKVNGTSVTSGGSANLITNTAYDATSNKLATMADIAGATSGVADVKVNNVSVVNNGIANLVTNTAYDATNNKIATMSDIGAAGGGTVTSVGITAGDHISVSGSPITTSGNITVGVKGDTVYYGTCTTAAATVKKAVTITGFPSTLAAGMKVAIRFSNSNTATSPTLSINSGTAIAIKRYGTTAAGTATYSSWNAGTVVPMTYDGTYWMIDGWINTTYSAISEANIESLTGTTSGMITGQRFTQGFNKRLTGSAITTALGYTPVEDVQVNGTTVVNNGVANLVTESAYDATINKIATMDDVPKVPPAGDTVTAVGTSSSAGSSLAWSRSDHVHNITSSTIESALGYTPYDSANPSGYTSNAGTVTGITAGAGLNTTSSDSSSDGGTISTNGTLYLTKTGITAGTYQGITVDKYGRVTAASDQDYLPKTGGDLTGDVTSTGSIVGAPDVLWEGTMQGGNDITLDVSAYKQIRVWFHTYAITFPVDVDLTIVPNNDVSTAYPDWYASSGMGAYYTNRAETYYGVVLVNPAKTTVRIHYIAFYYGTSYNARNNNANYFAYRVEGLRR